MRSKTGNKIWIFIIILFALGVRFISINQSLWLDEAINVLAVRDLSLSSLLNNYMVGDFHPPLFHIILWLWTRLIPISEMTVRLPSLLLGAATVYVLYLITSELLSDEKTNKSSWITYVPSILLALSGLHIYYSQEARMYSLACFLATACFYYFLRVKRNYTIKYSILYVLSLVLLLVSDYQPWLLLPLLLFLLPRLTLLSLLFSFPIWPLLLTQLRAGISAATQFPAWKMVVGGFSLKSIALVPIKFLIGRVSIDNNLIYGMFLAPALFVILFCFYFALKKPRSSNTNIIISWFLVPLLLGIGTSLFVPIFSYFRFLFLLPSFYLILTMGIKNMSRVGKFLSIGILVLTTASASVTYLMNDNFHRENWRNFAIYALKFPIDSTAVVFPNLAQSAGFDYYNTRGMRLADKDSLNEVDGYKTLIMVDYVSDIFDPQQTIEKHLKENNFTTAEELTLTGIKAIRYSHK